MKNSQPKTPPTPKYWIGQEIVFNRKDTDYHDKGERGKQIDVITAIDIVYDENIFCKEWLIRYSVEEHDDFVPESAILGEYRGI